MLQHGLSTRRGIHIVYVGTTENIKLIENLVGCAQHDQTARMGRVALPPLPSSRARQEGTSNKGAFFVGSTAAAARRSFFALGLS
jgi:hypothetical protein